MTPGRNEAGDVLFLPAQHSLPFCRQSPDFAWGRASPLCASSQALPRTTPAHLWPQPGPGVPLSQSSAPSRGFQSHKAWCKPGKTWSSLIPGGHSEKPALGFTGKSPWPLWLWPFLKPGSQLSLALWTTSHHTNKSPFCLSWPQVVSMAKHQSTLWQKPHRWVPPDTSLHLPPADSATRPP